MRIEKQTIIFIALTGLLLWWDHYMLAALPAILTIAELRQWWNNPYRKLWQRIRADASRHGVTIPHALAVKQNLMKLYSRVELLTTYHPFTRDGLTETLARMWQGLKYNPNQLAWAQEIHQTSLSLPKFSEVKAQ